MESERKRLFNARWKLAYNSARAKAVEEQKPGVALQVKSEVHKFGPR